MIRKEVGLQVITSIQRCGLWIYIALIGAARPWPRGHPWSVINMQVYIVLYILYHV